MRVMSVVAISISLISLTGCVVAAYPDHRPYHHYPVHASKPYYPAARVIHVQPQHHHGHHGHHQSHRHGHR